MMRRTNITTAVRAALWLGLTACSVTSQGQGLNNLWMGGYASYLGLPWGGADIDFISGTPQITYVNREMEYHRTSANITDSSGALLFSTNGYYIANALGDTMANGTGLNPSDYTVQFPDGLVINQADLILPLPGADGIFLLFHSTIDNVPEGTSEYLYLTAIDMNLDGGLGGVTSINQVLIHDDLNQGKITAVKHANGRDWWVFCHKVNSNTFYRLLVTPEGVSDPETQDIGILRPPDGGQVCFSPDGSKFAYYWGIEDLDIFDFDRCTGLFSNAVHIDIDDENAIGGVAFSPNSQLLYVPSLNDVYQFDVTASDIEGSMVHIATWDSFYSPSPPFATLFDIAQLAPDGKIYIGTGNSTFHLHVVNDPDVPGFGCNMVQHGLELPTYYQSTLPNHPNYYLGPVDGSVCDSLGINAGLPERGPPLRVGAYPNPSNGVCTLSYPAQASLGHLEVRALSGKLLLIARLPPWSTVHKVSLPGASTGMYQCTLTWPTQKATTRIVIEP